jgi:hypothetical protein
MRLGQAVQKLRLDGTIDGETVSPMTPRRPELGSPDPIGGQKVAGLGARATPIH